MVNDKINVVGTNIAEKATMIWNVADMLRGPFKPHEYGLVILPMTVVKRFHDCLLTTSDCPTYSFKEIVCGVRILYFVIPNCACRILAALSAQSVRIIKCRSH